MVNGYVLLVQEKSFFLHADKIEKRLFCSDKEDLAEYMRSQRITGDSFLCHISAVAQQSIKSVRPAFDYMQQGEEKIGFFPNAVYVTFFQKQDKMKAALCFYSVG